MRRYVFAVWWCLICSIVPGCHYKGPHRAPSYPVPETFSAYTENRLISNSPTEVDAEFWWRLFAVPELTELVECHLRNNYTLKAAYHRYHEACARYRVARSQRYPKLDSLVRVERREESDTLLLSQAYETQPESHFLAGLDMHWELDMWGRLRSLEQAGRARASVHMYGVYDLYVSLCAETARAYMTAAFAHYDYGVITALLRDTVRLRSSLYDAWQAGHVSAEAYYQIDGTYHALHQEAEQARDTYKRARHAVAVLQGLPPSSFSGFKRALPDVRDLVQRLCLPDVLPSELVRRRPDIRRAEQEYAGARHEQDVATADLFPRFSLLGSAAWVTSDESEWFSTDSIRWSFGPSVHFPVMRFGELTYTVAAKTAAAERARTHYAEVVTRAFGEVEDALVGYYTACRQYGASSDEVATAAAQAALRYDAYQAGHESHNTYLRACMQMHEKQRVQLKRAYEAVLAIIQVYKACGGGWSYVSDSTQDAR